MLITFRMCPKCNHNVPTDNIQNVISMWLGFWPNGSNILNIVDLSNVLSMCSQCAQWVKLGTLRSHDWAHSECDHHLPSGYIEFKFVGTFWMWSTFYPLGTLWTLGACTHNVLPMCPLGIWPLVPSVMVKIKEIQSKMGMDEPGSLANPHWGQGVKYPLGTLWVHCGHRHHVFTMWLVRKSWAHFEWEWPM